jgi:hypothetical protein
MSRKSASRHAPVKAARTAQVRPKAPAPPIDRLASWLARRSRATRLAIAGLIAVGLTGVTAYLVYGFLISLPPSSLRIGQTTPWDYLTVLLILLVIVGFVYYWIGWRVLIGFDFGDTPLIPGRPAALWVAFSLAVFAFTLCLIALNTLVAIAPA